MAGLQTQLINGVCVVWEVLVVCLTMLYRALRLIFQALVLAISYIRALVSRRLKKEVSVTRGVFDCIILFWRKWLWLAKTHAYPLLKGLFGSEVLSVCLTAYPAVTLNIQSLARGISTSKTLHQKAEAGEEWVYISQCVLVHDLDFWGINTKGTLKILQDVLYTEKACTSFTDLTLPSPTFWVLFDGGFTFSIIIELSSF